MFYDQPIPEVVPEEQDVPPTTTATMASTKAR